MARLSKELFLAWSSLSCTEHTPGWQAISLASIGTVDVQAGRRSPANAEAVLFCFPTARLARAEKLPEGKGFLVEKAGSTGREGCRLALTRQEAGSVELFATMVCDVIGAIDGAAASGESESRLLRVLIGRVIAWQQFMSKGATPLGPEAELGLVGELHFMTAFLGLGVPFEVVLNGWVGPDDAPQDFWFGDGAIEVKATMSSSGFRVKVGSLEQLDDSIASPLYLAAVRFATGEGGLTLPEMVAEVERRLEGSIGMVDFFRVRLLAAGYTDSHASQYSRRFEPKESRVFAVFEGFPRLTLGSTPIGVTRALYEINLDHAGQFTLDLGESLKRLGVIR